MTTDKLKQIIAMVGGFLGAVLLFLQALGVQYEWFTQSTIDSFLGVLIAGVPLAMIFYGIYKNTYLITEKAKEQENELKKRGLK